MAAAAAVAADEAIVVIFNLFVFIFVVIICVTFLLKSTRQTQTFHLLIKNAVSFILLFSISSAGLGNDNCFLRQQIFIIFYLFVNCLNKSDAMSYAFAIKM